MPDPFKAQPLGEPFVELQSVESSNNYAMARIHEDLARHGTAYFAHEQYAGKGQRHKTWSAQKGMNITMSLVIQPHALLSRNIFSLSACIAVSVMEFFDSYAAGDCYIKWPNDLYWRDRKAGGILIENIIGNSGWQWAVAGMGININETGFDKGLSNAVSLRQITGKEYSVTSLAKELCKIIDGNYKLLCNNGFQNILSRYNQALFKRNEIVKFRKQNRLFEALVVGVEADGRLLLKHAFEEHFNFGELEWVING